MDPLTHALSGALLARATASDRPCSLPLRTRMAAGSVAALFPDVDFVLRLGDTLTYLNWHQGITHAPLLLPAWAFLLARAFSRLDPDRHPWRRFYGPACLGIAIHIAGDLITAYGLMLLAPFSNQRYSLPIAFVIDPWITAILGAGLVAAALLPRKWHAAGLALFTLAAYLGFLASQRHSAHTASKAFAATRMLVVAEAQVLPQPLSPNNWLLIVGDGEHYHVARTNLAETRQPWPSASLLGGLRHMHAAYEPLAQVRWRRISRFGGTPAEETFAREAWGQPVFAGFRRFAAYPVLEGIDSDEWGRCAWFSDLRFDLPALPPSFRYGACRNGQGAWYLRRARGEFWID